MADFFLMLGTGLRWAGYIALPLFALPLLVLITDQLGETADRLARILDRISGLALGAAMVASVLMLIAMLAVVVARYSFGLAFSWLSELVTYSFAAMFLLAAAGALRDDEHVRVDILRERYGPRGRALVELLGAYLFVFPVCLLVFWSAISPSFVRSWAMFEGSRESDGLPLLFLFRTLVPLFATLLMAQGLSQALKAALILKGLRKPDSLHHSGGGA